MQTLDTLLTRAASAPRPSKLCSTPVECSLCTVCTADAEGKNLLCSTRKRLRSVPSLSAGTSQHEVMHVQASWIYAFAAWLFLECSALCIKRAGLSMQLSVT